MTDKSTEVIPLSSKPRFEILDGLRGVAAMIVVAFHLFETYSAGPKYQIVNHGVQAPYIQAIARIKRCWPYS